MSKSYVLRNRNYLENLVVAMLFTLPLFLFMLIYPKDMIGWLLVGISYLILFYVKEFRNSGNIFVSSVVVIFIHHVIAFVNAYIGPTVGGDADALGFHYDAKLMSEQGIDFEISVGSEFYRYFLSVPYRLFGASHFTGTMTSNIAFLFALIVFVKIMKEMKIEKHQAKLVLLFGALPTCIFYTPITLREPWEMLFFLLPVYIAVLIRQKKSLSRFIAFTLSLGILALWHNGLMVFAPILAILALWWVYSRKEGKSRGNKVAAVMISAALVGLWLVASKSGISSVATNALMSGDTLEYASSYQGNSAADSRASYGATLTDTSIFGLMKALPLMFFFYMFAPLPWQVGSMMDIYAFLESCLRFFLLISAYKTWKTSIGDEKRQYGFLLLAFIALEMLWAMGTINWGTAMRHHLVGYGILLLLGGPRMFDGFKKFIK